MVPKQFQVEAIRQDTPDTFTLELTSYDQTPFAFLPGQFNMLYLFSFGEIPLSISSDPSQSTLLTHTIRAVGAISHSLGMVKKGDILGVRGPFGTPWPLEKGAGHILLLAGGLGIAPIRPVLFYLASHREKYKTITLLYGVKNEGDLLYKEEIETWKRQGIDIKISVDNPGKNWEGDVGVITKQIKKNAPDPKATRAFLCGPEIMMKLAIDELLALSVKEEEIFLSMERNMKCAVGFCGHCQLGPHFVCKEGAVFSYPMVKHLLPIKEL